jgi:signal transduction histidine kinase
MLAHSLRNRITMWFTTTVIATVACVLLILHLRIQEETRAQVTAAMRSAGTVFLSQHRYRGENVRIAATLLGDLPKLGAAVAGSGADPPTITALVKDLKEVIDYDVLVVTNAHGIVVGDTQRPPAIGQSQRDDVSVRAALAGRTWTGTVAKHGHIYQSASAPIRVGGEILGTVQVGHEVNDQVAAKLKRETGSEVSFFSGPDLVASSLDRKGRVEVLAQLRDRSWPHTRFLANESFILFVAGRQYLSIAQPLHEGSTAITFLVQKSLDEALQPYRTIQQFLLGIGVLGLICAVVVSYAVAGGIADPILRVVRAAEALGRGDWSQRVDGSGEDEVGTLARTFNSMAAKLQSWDADLRGAVAERTAELNAMVTRLDRAFDQMRRFNADASHELRTPLTIVRGEAEVALRSPRAPEEYQGVLQSILEESERMGRIVENLLWLARADSGELLLERSSVALHDLLLDLQQPATVLARRSGVDLFFEIEEPLLVSGDTLRLHQLFLNLLDNATKYTPAGGTVRLRASEVREQVVVQVVDTGIGIGPKDLPLLFDRFFRADKARSRAMGGSGLGLAICKWIVEAHEGTITVTSTPGEGSIFTVALPTEPAEIRRERDARLVRATLS